MSFPRVSVIQGGECTGGGAACPDEAARAGADGRFERTSHREENEGEVLRNQGLGSNGIGWGGSIFVE